MSNWSRRAFREPWSGRQHATRTQSATASKWRPVPVTLRLLLAENGRS
jgi:hypothetical protein